MQKQYQLTARDEMQYMAQYLNNRNTAKLSSGEKGLYQIIERFVNSGLALTARMADFLKVEYGHLWPVLMHIAEQADLKQQKKEASNNAI